MSLGAWDHVAQGHSWRALLANAMSTILERARGTKTTSRVHW